MMKRHRTSPLPCRSIPLRISGAAAIPLGVCVSSRRGVAVGGGAASLEEDEDEKGRSARRPVAQACSLARHRGLATLAARAARSLRYLSAMSCIFLALTTRHDCRFIGSIAQLFKLCMYGTHYELVPAPGGGSARG